VLDPTVLPVCEASDADLYAQGAAACPPESRLGGGKIVSDNGGPGLPFPRLIENDVHLFNGGDHTLGVADSTNAPLIPGLTRLVTRSPVRGDPPTTTFELPPFPGGPPDGYTALKSIRLSGPAIVRGGRAGARTPPVCPESGYWTLVQTFTYRDGVSEQVESRSPCSPPGGGDDSTPPRVRIRGVPRTCASRGFTLRVRIVEPSSLRDAVLYVDGRRLHATTRKRFRKRVRVSRLRPGAHRLAIVARDSAGNRGRARRRFRRCGAGI
jgi:hypothetical protein